MSLCSAASFIWKVKSDIIQCIHLCFCMLAISFYFVNCVIISCKLSFNSRFTRNQIPITSFLGFKKAELGCKMSELHLYVVKRQNWVVIIRKWICFSILTPEGAPILLGINNFSHASRTRCKRCLGWFFTKKFPLRGIWFFTSHQQFFSYVGTGLPGLNQH